MERATRPGPASTPLGAGHPGASTAPGVGSRERWPDLVIGLAFLALAGLGIAAVFGPAIAEWFGGPDGAVSEGAPPTVLPMGPR